MQIRFRNFMDCVITSGKLFEFFVLLYYMLAQDSSFHTALVFMVPTFSCKWETKYSKMGPMSNVFFITCDGRWKYFQASSKIVISSINARYHDKRLSRPHIKGQDHGVTWRLSHLNGCNSFNYWRKFVVVLWAPTMSFKPIWRVAMARDSVWDVSRAP